MGNKDTSFSENIRAINCNGKLLDFEETRVMGILNLTSDSFYDGGKYSTQEHWIKQTHQMIDEGAHIIDIGAFSSRPGAELISEEEELKRLLPALKILTKTFSDTIFSVDTFRSNVALQCFENGAGIINDISGGNLDDNMFKTIASIKIPYVMMHMHGTPDIMQNEPIEKDVTIKVKMFFEKKIQEILNLGFNDIIIDPGYGFGKSLGSNYELLKDQEKLRINNLPILAGLSRKSMINKVIGTKPIDALNGTTVLNLLSIQNGANILRVHDVKEAIQTIKLFKFYQKDIL